MKKTLLSILFTISIVVLNAQTTVIPDANFEQALIDLGYDSGPIDGSVLTTSITSVDSLFLYNFNIADLTGIEDFVALTYLDCRYNQFISLDVTQNTALEILSCSNNQLTSLDVTQNTVLEFLNCTSNQLSTLDVSQNTALEMLFCGGNQLTSIDVSQNIELLNLHCDLNQLTSIDVSQNSEC
jgi:Leucine-rich repeat (LRR) protein